MTDHFCAIGIKHQPRSTLDDKEILTFWVKPVRRSLDIVLTDESENAARRAMLFSGSAK